MFIDLAKISVIAGKGGDGVVRFRREKYTPNGGPDGGDGGTGGNIIFEVNPGMSTLADFRYRRKYRAEDGVRGDGGNCNGRRGEDTVLKVPPGTIIKEAATGRVIADMDDDAKSVIIAKGGKGGKGNQHFSNSVRQAPRFATAGEAGEALELLLELKLIADVGLAGFPNAGKSTLIASVSGSRPKIAPYPFTTKEPNLGVVVLGPENSFVMADIPGIIEGASHGAGMGLEFLRHIERTRMLFLMIDLAETDDKDVISAYESVTAELAAYSASLATRPRYIVGNKLDVTGTQDKSELLRKRAALDGYEYYAISAATGEGVKELIRSAYAMLSSLPKPLPYNISDETVVFRQEKSAGFEIHLEDEAFVVEGPLVNRIFHSVDVNDNESMGYFQKMLRQTGIIDKLEAMGVNEGDTVRILDVEFEYIK